MKLREALELLKDFDQDHEVHFVTPADPGDGPPRLMLASAREPLVYDTACWCCGEVDDPDGPAMYCTSTARTGWSCRR